MTKKSWHLRKWIIRELHTVYLFIFPLDDTITVIAIYTISVSLKTQQHILKEMKNHKKAPREMGCLQPCVSGEQTL